MMRRRVLKYFVPVTFLSFVFSLPKFFESQVEYADESLFEDGYINEDNITGLTSVANSIKHSGQNFPKAFFYRHLISRGFLLKLFRTAN